MNLFKKKDPVLTAIHPDLKKLTKHIATIKDEEGKDVKLYEFATLHDMPSKRYAALNDFLEDRGRGIDRTELEFNIKECIKAIESNSTRGVTDCLIILRWMEQRLTIFNDLDFIERFISCAIFFEDEDLTKYDWDIGTRKIELFEKNGLSAFFLSEPIKRYWTSTNISEEDMEMLIHQKEMKKQVLKELSVMGISLLNT